jgi:hypothetical protein
VPKQLGRAPDDFTTGFSLNAAQIVADAFQIAAELASMLHAIAPNFFNNGIDHRTTASNSSGEQISGHRYPAFCTICRTIMRVQGLLRWAKFHVSNTSMPLTAAKPM